MSNTTAKAMQDVQEKHMREKVGKRDRESRLPPTYFPTKLRDLKKKLKELADERGHDLYENGSYNMTRIYDLLRKITECFRNLSHSQSVLRRQFFMFPVCVFSFPASRSR